MEVSLYVIDLGIDPLIGKRTQKKKRGLNTKKEAEHALSEFLNDVRLGNYVEPDKITLGDFIQDWLIEVKKERIVVIGHKLKQGPNFNDYDLVVCTRCGNPLDFTTLSKRLKAQSLKLGLPIIRFHDLRHTTRNHTNQAKCEC